MRISDWSSDVCSSDLAYVGKVFQAVGGQQISYSQPRRTTVNGLEAAVSTARANTQSGPVDVTVTAYRWSGDPAFHFLTVTPASKGAGPLTAMLTSINRLSDAEAASTPPTVLPLAEVN